MKIVFDNGKDSCKYKINGKKFIVPSKIEEGISTFSNETITYEGKNYIVGKEADDYNYSFTKSNLHHKIMMYYCIVRHIKDKEDLDIIMGCPLSTYMNKTKQENYINYFINNKEPISIMYKKSLKTFTINSITMVPESIGGYINDYEVAKKEIRGIIDIGGLNINCGVYDKGNPVKSKMFTLNMGINILIKNIQQALLREKEELISYYMCKHYLLNLEQLDNYIYDIFDKECYLFIDKIKKALIKNDWELNQLNLRFIGGGSLSLSKYINELFNNPYIEKSIFANCDAFERFGDKKRHAKNKIMG